MSNEPAKPKRAVYDITPPITPNLGVWPGDTPPSRDVLMDIAKGDTVTLSTLRTTVHLGAHADGPNHYGLNAPSIDQRPLDRYLGLCQVMPIDIARGERFGVAQLTDAIRAERVLFETGTFPDPENWNDDFAAIDPDLIDHLAAHGVKLVGLDTPSVDLKESKDLPTHRRILQHDLALLEALVLKRVPAGLYELIALPLPLVGFDASPVRAVLRELD